MRGVTKVSPEETLFCCLSDAPLYSSTCSSSSPPLFYLSSSLYTLPSAVRVRISLSIFDRLPRIVCLLCSAAKSLIVQSQTPITLQSYFPTVCVCVHVCLILVCLFVPVCCCVVLLLPPLLPNPAVSDRVSWH